MTDMIFATLLILAVQEAPVAQDPPGSAVQGTSVTEPASTANGGQRWSILADPCAADRAGPNQIVVCGKSAAESPRLPLPDERGPPDRPMPSNPDLSGMGALNAASTPCAAQIGGCQVGVDIFGGGTFLVRAVGKLIDPNSCCEEPGESRNFGKLIGDVAKGVGKPFKKKVDKSGRVPIPLDDPEPANRPATGP